MSNQVTEFQNTWTRLYFIDMHANMYIVMYVMSIKVDKFQNTDMVIFCRYACKYVHHYVCDERHWVKGSSIRVSDIKKKT